VSADLQEQLTQPIWGWIGRRDAFEMGRGYQKAAGVRGFVSGTPPILAMVPLAAAVDQLARAGLPRVRTKSVQLTEFAVDMVDQLLVPLGVELASPRSTHLRGGHITLRKRGFRAVNERLWAGGVLPDYREPDGIRIGPAPLSTSFAEVTRGLLALRYEVVT
jgi:kynureninase